MVRALSLREISRCEAAQERVCKCRCGGALHGVARGAGAKFFAGLPSDDPHHFVTPEARKAREQQERDERNRRRYEVLAAPPKEG